MAKHVFDESQQLAGVRAALKTLRDAKARRLRGKPIWLIDSLERREAVLEQKLGTISQKSKKPARSFLTGILGGRAS